MRWFDVVLSKDREKLIVVENNATGQLAGLSTCTFGYAAHEKILKYNGMPFSVEELVEKIGKVFREKRDSPRRHGEQRVEIKKSLL